MGRLIAIIPLIDGAVAQLGERLLCTEEVRGSSPLSSTFYQECYHVHFFWLIYTTSGSAGERLAQRINLPLEGERARQ